MTTKDYTYLLNKPHTLNERHTTELERILTEFPYLQSARAIYLKGLYNNDSFRYNNELKKTAAYTTDRTILFEFITSEQFRSVDSSLLEAEQNAVATIEVTEATGATNDTVHPKKEMPRLKANDASLSGIEKLEHSIKMLIRNPEPETLSEEEVNEDKSVTSSENAAVTTTLEQNNEVETANILSETFTTKPAAEPIGSPLKFDQAETHSFAEWLQLSRLKPIDRGTSLSNEEKVESTLITPEKQEPASTETAAGLTKKLDIIDKFIETNPKIAPVKTDKSAWENISRKTTDTPGIMTETLARVYLEQKKYAKAIQAYEILILKYPEKSAFFADRILEIKDLQQNNN